VRLQKCETWAPVPSCNPADLCFSARVCPLGLLASTQLSLRLGAAPAWVGEGGGVVGMWILRWPFVVTCPPRCFACVRCVSSARAVPGAAAGHPATHNILTTPATAGMSSSCFGIVRSPFAVVALPHLRVAALGVAMTVQSCTPACVFSLMHPPPSPALGGRPWSLCVCECACFLGSRVSRAHVVRAPFGPNGVVLLTPLHRDAGERELRRQACQLWWVGRGYEPMHSLSTIQLC
jgi:hypothetical protein